MTKAKRWKPKEGEIYWFVDRDGYLCYLFWLDLHTDRTLYRLGNCFRTRKEADAVARKLKGFWKDVREGQL